MIHHKVIAIYACMVCLGVLCMHADIDICVSVRKAYLIDCERVDVCSAAHRIVCMRLCDACMYRMYVRSACMYGVCDACACKSRQS